jgi:hypothetical protein
VQDLNSYLQEELEVLMNNDHADTVERRRGSGARGSDEEDDSNDQGAGRKGAPIKKYSGGTTEAQALLSVTLSKRDQEVSNLRKKVSELESRLAEAHRQARPQM